MGTWGTFLWPIMSAMIRCSTSLWSMIDAKVWRMTQESSSWGNPASRKTTPVRHESASLSSCLPSSRTKPTGASAPEVFLSWAVLDLNQ